MSGLVSPHPMLLPEKLPPHKKIQVLLQIQPQFVVKQKVSAALKQSSPKIDTSIVYLHSYFIPAIVRTLVL